MMNIHSRIEYIILQEKLSIAAFERQIGVGRKFPFHFVEKTVCDLS